jgi:alpha-tubulin suppressor-like RCC1 family protein
MIFENGNIIHQYNSTSAELSVTANKLYIEPIADLAHNSNYHVKIDNGFVTGASGNTFGGFSYPTEWNFHTEAAPVTTFTGSLIAAGRATVFIADPNGSALSRGRQEKGQLGRVGDASIFASIGLPANPVSISVGESHGLALTTDGNVFSWGDGSHGQAHSGTAQEETSISSKVVFIEAGSNSSFVITDNNQLWAKGHNHMGQLGVGDSADKAVWTQVTLPAGNIQAVSSGVEHTLVLIDGKVFGFGSDGFRQLNQSGGLHTTPVAVLSGSDWTRVEVGGFHSIVEKQSGGLFGFGKNDRGQLGLGHTQAVVQPEQPITLPGSISQIVDFAAGFDHTVVIVNHLGATRVLGTGSNHFGQTSIAGASSSVNFLNADPMINNAVEVDAGPHSTLIFSSANVLMGTGVLSNQLKPKLEFLIDNN